MLDLGTGWSNAGIGTPNPYPMTYYAALPMALLGRIAGSTVAMGILVAFLAVALTWSAFRIAERFGLGAIGTTSLWMLFCFNPWVYNKLVAGHLTQIIAYSGIAIVLLEVFHGLTSRRTLLLATFLAALQIQFFIIALIALAFRVRSIEARSAIFLGSIVASPSLVGIALDRWDLSQWPFLLSWEMNQSVAVSKGALLQGYFPHYAEHAFTGAWEVFPALFVVLAVYGAVYPGIGVRSARLVAILALTLLLIAGGTSGPLATMAVWMVLHFRGTAVFRELYDLIGIVAACYAISTGRAISVSRFFRIIAPFAASGMLGAWFYYPPFHFWVGSSLIPPLPTSVRADSRYALMPPFQPYSMNETGSGIDPAYEPQSFSGGPINSILAMYPVSAALARYQRSHDSTMLRALGVRTIVCRPLEESMAAKVFYGPFPARSDCGTSSFRLHSVSPVALATRSISICSLCADLPDGSVFFGDAGMTFHSIRIPRRTDDPNQTWIDARLIFARVPKLAQPLGGVYTTQATKGWTVPKDQAILAWVTGTLIDARGHLLTTTTNGYRWIRLTHETMLYCHGKCLIAATGTPPHVSLEPASVPFIPIKIDFLAPFVALATVPQSYRYLEWKEAFDPGWTAISFHPLRKLRHFPVDHVFNAWTLPTARHGMSILIVHIPSLLQLAASIIGMATIAGVILRGWTERTTRLGSDPYSPRRETQELLDST